MLYKLCDSPFVEHLFGGDAANGSSSVTAAPEKEPCSFYAVQLIVNGIFIYVVLLLLIYHKCWKNGPCSPKSRRRPTENVSSPQQLRPIPGKRGSNNGNTHPQWNTRFSRTDSLLDAKKVSEWFQRRTVFRHHVAIWSLTLWILVSVGADLSENVIIFVNRQSNSSIGKSQPNGNVSGHIGHSDSVLSAFVPHHDDEQVRTKRSVSNDHSHPFSLPVTVNTTTGQQKRHSPDDDVHNKPANGFISRAPSTLFENNDSNGPLIGLTASRLLSLDDNAGAAAAPLSPPVLKSVHRRASGNEDNQTNSSNNPSAHQIIYEYLKVIGPLVTLTAVSSLLWFYHQFERLGQPKYLLLNVFYFLLCALLFLANVHLHWALQSLSLFHVKVAMNLSCLLASVTLLVLLARTVIHEKRGSGLSSVSSPATPVTGEEIQEDDESRVKKQPRRRSSYPSSNIRYLHNYSTLPSRITFYWFTGLLRLGYWHPLEEEDLGDLPEEEKTSTQLKRFLKVYQVERNACPGALFSLWKCLFKTIWPSLLVGGLFRLLADFTGFIAPLGIKGIVAYTEQNYTLYEDVNNKEDGNAGSAESLTISQLISNGYVMALIVLLASFLQSTFSQCSTFLVNSEGIHIKFALQALIYKKALTLSPTKAAQSVEVTGDEEGDVEDDKASGTSSTGHSSNTTTTTTHGFDNGSIVNIMSEDTNNVMMFFWMAHFIWAIPLKLAILMTLLYLQLGYSALIGAGVCILIMIPLQFLIGKKMSSNSKELMERCDERLRTTSEILQGIKLLKLYGWELLLSERVYGIRQKELKNLDRDLLYRSVMTFLTHISSVLVTVVTFGLYPYIESEKLEPPKVFAGLALFNQLTVPLFIFPITVPVVIDALVSTRRVRDFLLLPEASSLPDQQESAPSAPNGKEGGGKSPLTAKKAPQNLMPLMSSKGKSNIDLQASSDSVFVLENIAEDEEEQDGSNRDVDATTKLLPPAATPNGDSNAKKWREEGGDKEAKVVVWVKNASFTWEENSASSQLNSLPGTGSSHHRHQHHPHRKHRASGLADISVEIPQEKLTVVVGATGSGKSSFVSALLGEMRKTGGEMRWAPHTSIAYAAQKPWMLNASVRENILFGRPFKPGRYKKVIQACALEPDIEILPENDFTEIGQKGINLSGGQKQRIATARALYSNANVVILDDPLSALDVEVAHQVLDQGIIKFLLRSRRTVILVTHHLPVLHHAHHIIAIERGGIRIQGTLQEIQVRDPPCYQEWQEMITRKEQELHIQREAKTAKERWSLLKLVSRVGLQFKNVRMGDKQWKNTEEETNAQLEPFRKKKGTFSHYKNLSHDIFLPSDECHDDMMTPLLRRRAVSRTTRESRTSSSSSKHVKLQRMSSLQPESVTAKNRSPSVGKKFKRLQSLPVDEDVTVNTVVSTTPEGNVVVGLPKKGTSASNLADSGPLPSPRAAPDNLFKKLFSSKKTSSSTGSVNAELEKVAPSSRLPSTISGASETDLTEEEGEDPDDPLLARESTQDEREYGKIPWKVYLSYIRACGQVVSGLYLYSAVGYEVVRVCTNFWLSRWSDTVYMYKDDQEKYDEIMSYYFNIYVVLSMATVIVSLSCNLLGKQAGANSREVLHQRMMDRVVRCPVRFFESTPIGRIINRFSSDVAVIDRKLCISMQRFLQFVFLCLSAIVVNAIVNAWFLLVAIPIVGIYYYIQRFYRFSSRELQRIQAISRGPIYSHFHETLEGLSTIRAFREQKRFTNHMLSTLDAHNKADMFINVGNRWLSISLDYLGGVIVYLATIVAVLSSHIYPDTVTASMVGLAINYTLLVPVYLNWVVKFLAEVEMFMNSVDRIDRYSTLDVEDYEGTLPPNSLPPGWPTKGEVTLDNIFVHYGPDRPAIISDLSVAIPPQQKVGVCGRSGSGKSSLLMALFRISDVRQGRILIDGVNIQQLPLQKLRSSFSIIPQENIIFSGTLRFNLDPTGKIPDHEMWRALELCQMKEAVREMPGQLDTDLNRGGDSFSAGEKQLLALARAILHKSKVVIMDEATSSVDVATERTLIQVVKDAFKDSTVITVAHRLDTLIDGDRVLVLDDGVLVEDGVPAELVKKPMSHFATMVRNTSEQHRYNT